MSDELTIPEAIEAAKRIGKNMEKAIEQDRQLEALIQQGVLDPFIVDVRGDIDKLEARVAALEESIEALKALIDDNCHDDMFNFVVYTDPEQYKAAKDEIAASVFNNGFKADMFTE